MNEEKENMSLKRRKTFLWVVREGEGGGLVPPSPSPPAALFRPRGGSAARAASLVTAPGSGVKKMLFSVRSG